MDDYTQYAIEMLEAARPASGFRPETPEEWVKLQNAIEELCFAMFRMSGSSDTAARQLARQIYGGPTGLLLLDLAYRETNFE
jgi:hypothetical protein